jgi:heme/copper-type cytochrome/quinol oxidase subunit 3
MATTSIGAVRGPTTSADGVPVGTLPVGAEGAEAVGWWGMVFFILTEAALFAYLFLSYFYLGSRYPVWPPSGPPEIALAVINTVILVGSSIPMWIAERAMRRGQMGVFNILLLIVLVMGVAFLIIEATEWGRQSFTPATNAYGSLFYTITGFHFAHVTLGLLMTIELLYRSWAKRMSKRSPLAAKNVAAYWHFVGVVWVVLFFVIYLSPRW